LFFGVPLHGNWPVEALAQCRVTLLAPVQPLVPVLALLAVIWTINTKKATLTDLTPMNGISILEFFVKNKKRISKVLKRRETDGNIRRNGNPAVLG
jgi:hypothetical protein